MLGPDGKRLAKRHEDIAVSVLRETGARPEAVVGLLAWLYGLLERAEPLKVRDLIAHFDPERIPKESVTLPEDWQRIAGVV
jgi:glutamyl-tRNA synthetase